MLGTVVERLTAGLDRTLGVLFQTRCSLCGRRAERAVCAACRPAHFLEGPLCRRCGIVLPASMDRCGDCLARRGDRAFAVAEARSLLWYGETARVLLHKVKYAGRFELLELFREAFEQGFERGGTGTTAVVPVPLDPVRLAGRGFNQAAVLGRWVAEARGAELHGDGDFVKRRATAPQSTLGRKERERNLARCFHWAAPRPPPERVLLVDDVYTTGTTLDACARVLRSAGTAEVRAWTLFRTPAPGGVNG